MASFLSSWHLIIMSPCHLAIMPKEKRMQYTSKNILVKPTENPADPDLILSITPADAGWDYINFQARQLATGASWSFSSGEHELAIINLTGVYSVTSNRGDWTGIGGRQNVFTGGAHALYLPRRTDFTVTAETGGEFAVLGEVAIDQGSAAGARLAGSAQGPEIADDVGGDLGVHA